MPQKNAVREMNDPKTPKDRIEEINEAVKMASEFAKYCLQNGIGPLTLVQDGIGSVTWSGKTRRS